MLVLTRKQGEQIRIGKDVTITVVRTKGKAVRIGIEAPAEMNVLRGELVDPSQPQSTALGKGARTPNRRPSERRDAGHRWTPDATQPEKRAYRDQALAEDAAKSAATGGPLRAMMAAQAIS